MTSPFFGIQFNQIDTDPLPPIFGDFSIGAIVSFSDDANATTFPQNTCVLVNSGDSTVLAALGTGLLAKAVARVNAQLADLQRSMQLVIVRVACAYLQDGVTIDPVATMANLLGSSAAGTGIYALLKAPQVCNVTPRLIIVPGFTGQTTYAVTGPVITAAGDNYTHPVVTFTPSGAAATATVGNAGVTALAAATLAGGGVGSVAVSNSGQDYGSVPSVAFSGGGGTGAAAHAVLNGNGQVDHIVVDTPGTGYTSAPTVTIAAPAGGQITAINLTSPGNYAPGITPTIAITDSNGGSGTGAEATITLEQLANPICAALPAVCTSLLAHALVGGPGGTKADAFAWRALINSQRVIPQDDWEIVETLDGTNTEYMDGVCRSLGLAGRTDFQNNGYPFHAWANVPVQGALGLKRIDGFSLFDGATDAQELLAAGIGVTVRGDASDTSLDDSGFVAVSVNNASSNVLYNLYNKTRGTDYINVALAKALRKRIGVKNVTLKAIDAVLDDMTAINIAIQSQDDPGIVGFKVGFNAPDNTVEGLRAGKIVVFDDTEIPAPILQITVNRGLDRDALTNELEQFAAATSTVTS